jgi:hypothetical protein
VATSVRVLLAVAAVSVTVVSAGCTAPQSPPTSTTAPTVAPSGPDAAAVERFLSQRFELTTDPACREISVTFEGLSFRSRDFPQSWGPGKAISGQFIAFTPESSTATFRTSDGDEVLFLGGEGAMFTTDCPLY